MQRVLTCLIYSVFCWCSLVNAANFIAVIDAGSTGSRFHLYAYDAQSAQLQEIFQFRVKPGIDQYSQQQKLIQQGYAQIFNEASKVLALKTTDRPVPVYLLATGGMRFLSADEQTNIYNHLREDIAKYSQFKLKAVKTISGEQEARYGWLAVNDVYGTLGKTAKDTLGLIDLGGASMEIAFARREPTDGAKKICIRQQCYWLTADSILDIGIEHSLGHIQQYPSSGTCSPVEEYDLASCELITAESVNDKLAHLKKDIPLNRTYVATAGFYYTFNFFQANATVDNLEDKTIEACQNTPWPELVNQHPDLDPDRIRKYCFATALIATILTEPNGFGFTTGKPNLIVAKRVHNQDIAWARGAALHIIEKVA